MFRRPFLATAVVVGASRAAARHEVANQAQLNAEAKRAADRQVQEALTQEARNEERIQAAVAAALEKEKMKNATTAPANQHGTAVETQPGGTKAAPTMHCLKCGELRKPEDKFCSRCGFRHQDINSAGAAPPQYLQDQSQQGMGHMGNAV